jgi:hypothetical protein
LIAKLDWNKTDECLTRNSLYAVTVLTEAARLG